MWVWFEANHHDFEKELRTFSEPSRNRREMDNPMFKLRLMPMLVPEGKVSRYAGSHSPVRMGLDALQNDSTCQCKLAGQTERPGAKSAVPIFGVNFQTADARP